MTAPLRDAEAKAKEVARLLKAAMPEGWGFFLALASHGPAGSMTYCASIGRADAIKLLRELADKLEVNA